MQLALDALDRLVDALEECGSLSAREAARALFATSSISDGLACSLLAEVTAGDSRVVCDGATVSLAGRRADPLLEEAEFVVFDLETTGLSAVRCHICEIGAVRVRALEPVDSFQSLVNPGVALPEPIARLTGLREDELRRAASVFPSPRSAQPLSPVACSKAACAASALPRSPTSSACRPDPATAPFPMPRRRPKSWCT